MYDKRTRGVICVVIPNFLKEIVAVLDVKKGENKEDA